MCLNMEGHVLLRTAEVSWDVVYQSVLTLFQTLLPWSKHLNQPNFIMTWPIRWNIRVRTQITGYVFWWFSETLSTLWNCRSLLSRANSAGLDHSGIQHRNCFFIYVSSKRSRYKLWTTNLFDVNTGHAHLLKIKVNEATHRHFRGHVVDRGAVPPQQFVHTVMPSKIASLYGKFIFL